MYLKKLIGAFTALIMTVTVFAGSAVTVSAYSEENGEGKFPLDIKHNDVEWGGYADSTEEFNKFINGSGYTFEHDNVTYIVTGSNFKFESSTPSADVTVSEAVTLDIPDDIEGATINVTSNTVGSYTDDGDYVTAKDATVTISIKAPSGQQIKSVTIDDVVQSIDANAASWVDTYQMNKDAKLEVEFAGTYTITVTQSDNGLVSPSKFSAMQGEKVTMVIAPDAGYQLKDLKVTYDGNQVDVKGVGNNREFTMPGGNVTISAEFEQIPVYPQSPAVHIADYEDSGSTPASLWEGTLRGLGTVFYPKVTVKLANSNEEKAAVGATTITGDSSITIAVVVDKVEDDIDSVMLEGVAERNDYPTFTIETKEVDQ